MWLERVAPLRAREGVVVWLGEIPLRLAFRAREGGGVVRKHPPPSHISSEGGAAIPKKTVSEQI